MGRNDPPKDNRPHSLEPINVTLFGKGSLQMRLANGVEEREERLPYLLGLQPQLGPQRS